MATRIKKFCSRSGCSLLVEGGRYCKEHVSEQEDIDRQRKRAAEKRRSNAHDRGYDYSWSKYSKWFLRQPQNQFCVLREGEGCAGVAQCVDHIKPHSGRSDPLFWDKRNHQPACIYCNSSKGNKERRGAYVFGEMV